MGGCIERGRCIFVPTRWKGLSALLICLILAAWLRFGELERMKKQPLDPDAERFIDLAQKMRPFSDTGFYSARFNMREPLYLAVVKGFLSLPGPPGLNIRYVSFTFSLLAVFLTYLLVSTWMGSATGLVAAFLIALQAYCIELSARGLRSEFFTLLFLLFIYFAFIKPGLDPFARVAGTGIMAGLLFLTRGESVFPVILFFLACPIFLKNYWNKRKALLAFSIGLVIYMPHILAVYKVHGDPFYPSNQNARFYTNLEFAGLPGFPSKEKIEKGGMYAGPEITFIDYFFRYHTPRELLTGNLLGICKIYVYLILRYIPTPAWTLLKQKPVRIPEWGKYILFNHPIRAFLAFLVGASFMGGLWILRNTGYRFLYLALLIFQVQTAFLFYVGLETRAVVHTWPVALWIAAFFIVNSAKKLLPDINVKPKGSIPRGIDVKPVIFPGEG